MKKFALAITIAGLFLAGKASASTACVGTLDTLIALGAGGCTVGNLMFYNFGYSASANPSGLALPASSFTVSPDNTPGDEGLHFATGMNVVTQAGGLSAFQDSLISFDVLGLNGVMLDDLGLNFNGNQSGTGSANIAETYCLNSLVTTGCPQGNSGQLSVFNPPPIFGTHVNFNQLASFLSVSKDINVTSGVGTPNVNTNDIAAAYTPGVASISSFDQQFSNSSVPEPGTFAMLGGGLLIAGILRRRAARK